MRPLAALLCAAALAGGCASFDGRGLVPGKSTRAEVEALMGTPAEKRSVAGGDTVWYFPRQPSGLHTYAARFSPDGVLREIDQRLTVANLAKLVPGTTTRDAADELLGPPWRKSHNFLADREVWDYRMYNAVQVEHNLSLQFSDDGLLREVLLLRDYRNEPGGRKGK